MAVSKWSGIESLEGRRLLTAFWGLTSGDELVRFRSEDLSAVPAPVKISGLGVGESIQSIDVRNRTGEVLGISSTGRLFSIDGNTGAARLILDMSQVWADPRGLSITSSMPETRDLRIDKVRIVSPTGQNLRVDLSRDFGVLGLENLAGFESNLPLTYGGTGGGVGGGTSGAVALVDVAHDDRGEITFGIDLSRSMLVRQERFESDAFYDLELRSTFVPVGPLGRSLESARLEVARGVRNQNGLYGDNVGYVLARDVGDSREMLFEVSLATGALTMVGQVGGGVAIRDFAFDSGSVLFAPATAYSINGRVDVPVHRSSGVGEARATIHVPVTVMGGLPSSMPGEVLFADGQTTAILSFPAPTKSFLFEISPDSNLMRWVSVSVSANSSNPFESSGVVLPPLSPRVLEPDGVQSVRRVFEVTLSRPATQVVSLSLGIGEGGTATRGVDYEVSTPILVTFAPGQLTALVDVDVFGDRLVEGSEFFELVVNSISGAAIEQSGVNPWSGRVGIQNVNRADVPVVTVEGGTWLQVVEPAPGERKDVEIWVNLNAPSNESITVRVRSQSNSVGGAVEGEDFILKDTVLVFGPGEVRKMLRLTLLGSTSSEGVEFTSIVLESEQARVDYGINFGITVQFASHEVVPPVVPATWSFSTSGLPESTTATRSRSKMTTRMVSSTGAMPPKVARLSVRLVEGPVGMMYRQTVVARNGVATYYSPTLVRAGRYEFVVSAVGVESEEVVMQVVPGARQRLVIGKPTAPVMVGSPFNLWVSAVDRFGNLIGDYAMSATASLKGRRGVGLEGQVQSTFAEGTAVFSQLKISGRGSYLVEVRDGGAGGVARMSLRVR